MVETAQKTDEIPWIFEGNCSLIVLFTNKGNLERKIRETDGYLH